MIKKTFVQQNFDFWSFILSYVSSDCTRIFSKKHLWQVLPSLSLAWHIWPCLTRGNILRGFLFLDTLSAKNLRLWLTFPEISKNPTIWLDNATFRTITWNFPFNLRRKYFYSSISQLIFHSELSFNLVIWSRQSKDSIGKST